MEKESGFTPEITSEKEAGEPKSLKQRMIEKAIEKHGEIFPCGMESNLEGGFRTKGSKLIFYYNTADNSSHIIEEDLNN
ncbi:MAG: hypothetical protein WC415_06525 [Patescibacteria group bacterium]|jgi:hypothetical protein